MPIYWSIVALGKFSLQYTLAAALIDGPLGIDHFLDETVAREDIQDMMKKIELDIDSTIPEAAYGRWIILDIELANGDHLTVRCDKPEGHYHRESVTTDRHRIKIHDCVRRLMSEDEEEEFVSRAGRFHTLSSAEAGRLMTLCGTAGNG